MQSMLKKWRIDCQRTYPDFSYVASGPLVEWNPLFDFSYDVSARRLTAFLLQNLERGKYYLSGQITRSGSFSFAMFLSFM